MARRSSPVKQAEPTPADDSVQPEEARFEQEKKPEPVRKVAAPVVSRTPETVLVANHRTGAILFPQRGPNGLPLPPLTLGPGMVARITKEEWEQRKKNRVVQAWLDAGLLSVVRSEKPAQVTTDRTIDLDSLVPEHLQTAEEEQQGTMAKAGLRKDRTKAGTVQIG